MSIYRKIRLALTGATLALGITLAGSAQASADDGYGYGQQQYSRPVVHYRTVIREYTVWVTRYKPCGTPYRCPVTIYRNVYVPVYGY